MLRDQIDRLEAFNAHGVEYLAVGGHAGSVHRTPRVTKDLDLWINGQPKNGEAVFRAHASFGAPLSEISVANFSGDPEMVFQIGVPPHRVDIMQSISGLRFDEAWSRRVSGMVDGKVPVFFLSAEDLITNKLAVGRPRDLGGVDDVRKSMEGSDK